MKCKRCNGTGKIKQPMCNGGHCRKYTCPYCNGTGEITQTNDDWRKTCSAEEVADFLCRLLKGHDLLIGCLSLRTIINDEVEHGRNGNQSVMEWLKERHDGSK